MSIWSRRATQQPTVLAATRVGRGAVGASLCREPSQYRHIASGSPPRPASHIASVAHVPIYEIGSTHAGRRAGFEMGMSEPCMAQHGSSKVIYLRLPVLSR